MTEREDDTERPEADFADERREGLVRRIRARFAGRIRTAPGVDLAAPTGELWDAERD